MKDVICPRCNSENIVKNGNTIYGKPNVITSYSIHYTKLYDMPGFRTAATSIVWTKPIWLWDRRSLPDFWVGIFRSCLPDWQGWPAITANTEISVTGWRKMKRDSETCQHPIRTGKLRRVFQISDNTRNNFV